MDRNKVVLGFLGSGVILCILVMMLCAVGIALSKPEQPYTPETFQLCLDMGGKRTQVITENGMVDGCLVDIP